MTQSTARLNERMLAHKHWSIHDTVHKMTLVTPGLLSSFLLYSPLFISKWFLPQKSEAASRLQIILCLREFDCELEWNSTKEQYRSLKSGECWQSAKILLQRSLDARQPEKWQDLKNKSTTMTPVVIICRHFTVPAKMQERKRALWIHSDTVF